MEAFEEGQTSERFASMVARNQQLWTALQSAGVTTETELRLDFFYDSADSSSDAELAEFLRRETDYDVQLGGSEYGVTGATQPTTVDPEKLDQWVAWMVMAGHEHGHCKFDGWGAAVQKT